MPTNTALTRSAFVVGLLLASAVVPTLSRAQPASNATTWRITPAVGAIFDDYDAGDDGSTAGALFQLHLARHISGPLMGAATFGYARVDDIGFHQPEPPYLLFRNEWIFASAGPAIELPLQRATLGLAVEVGAAWRRTPVSGAIGGAQPNSWFGEDGYSVRALLLPRIAVHYPIGPSIDLGVTAGAYILNIPESLRTSPTIGLGVSFKP